MLGHLSVTGCSDGYDCDPGTYKKGKVCTPIPDVGINSFLVREQGAEANVVDSNNPPNQCQLVLTEENLVGEYVFQSNIITSTCVLPSLMQGDTFAGDLVITQENNVFEAILKNEMMQMAGIEGIPGTASVEQHGRMLVKIKAQNELLAIDGKLECCFIDAQTGKGDFQLTITLSSGSPCYAKAEATVTRK